MPNTPLDLGLPSGSRTSTNAYERARLAATNVLQGRPAVAGRALLDPASLSVPERQTLSERWGLNEGWTGTFLRAAENPLVLIGAVLALRFPLPSAKNLFRLSEKLTGPQGLLRRTGFLRTRIVGNIDDIYADLKAGDSTLPEVYKALLRDVSGFHRKHSENVQTAISQWEAKTGRLFKPRDEVLIAARLNGMEGRVVRPLADPASIELASKMRVSFDAMHKEVFSAADKSAFLRALAERKLSVDEFRRVVSSQGATSSVARSVLAKRTALRNQIMQQIRNGGGVSETYPRVGYKKDYWPWMVSRSWQDVDREVARLASSQGESSYGRAMISAAGTKAPSAAAERRGRMLPDPDDLSLIKDQLVDPTLPDRIRARMATTGTVLPYSLRVQKAVPSYIHSMSRAFGWTVRGHGDKILDAAARLESSGLPHNAVRASMLRDSFIPVALGRQTYRQFLAGAYWDDLKYAAINTVRSPAAKKWMPTEARDWIEKKLIEDRGLFTLRNVQGRLASLFFTGALGANVPAATMNLMQTVLTTAPVIGAKATGQGLSAVIKKTPRYFSARNRGIEHNRAMALAFPEFSREGLTAAPLTEEALLVEDIVGRTLNDAWLGTSKAKLTPGRVYDRARAALMSLFQSSEAVVRLTAFEGAMAKGIGEGLSRAEAATIARRVTETTQFLTGPAATPAALLNSGPLLRQFGTFAARYAGFLAGPARELGSAADAFRVGPFAGQNWGTLGRAALASGLAYEAGQEFLGADLSQGLMFGALPQPVEGSPFYPSPFVPPVLGVLGGAAQSVLQGESQPLLRQLPLLVPGGVAAARAAEAVAPSVAKALGRRYADYDNIRDDGTIPVYSGAGALQGNLTPAQLWLDALGVVPGGIPTLQQERELTQFLKANTDRIVGYKRNFLDALYRNDFRKAEFIDAEYQNAMGMGPIAVKPQDWKATHVRHMIPRLERMLDSMPADVRDEYSGIVAQALMQESESLLGVHPAMLTITDTAAERDPYRQGQPSNVIELLRQRQMRNGVSR